MDRIAGDLGIDPLEFRLENHVPREGQPGQRQSAPDQIIDSQPLEGGIPFSSNELHQCLRRGAEAFGWDIPLRSPTDPFLKRGKGMAMMIYRGGPGSVSAAEVRIDRSGRITLTSGLMDVGEGASTVLPQMAADVLGVSAGDIATHFADSADTPDAPITAGSTATFSTGTAVVQAATEVRRRLQEIASIGLEAPVNELEAAGGAIFVGSDPSRRMTIPEVAARMDEDHISAEATITPGSPDCIVNSFGAHFCARSRSTLPPEGSASYATSPPTTPAASSTHVSH